MAFCVHRKLEQECVICSTEAIKTLKENITNVKPQQMDKKTFLNNYISTFLATWTANHYEEYIMNNKHEDLGKPPVEDAIFLANEAWKKYQLVSKN